MASKRPSITQALRRAVAARDGLVEGGTAPTACAYCQAPLLWTWTDKRVRLLDADGRSTPELDHVVPLFQGGAHHADNLVPSCLSCNRSKCHRTITGQALKHLPKPTLEQVLEQQAKQPRGNSSSTEVLPRFNPVPYPSRTRTRPARPDHSRFTHADGFRANCTLLRQSRGRACEARPRARAAA